MITAKQVKEALLRQELTQQQVANAAKVSPSVLSNWFAGRREPSDIVKAHVALALGLADETASAAAPSPEDAAALEIMDALGMGEAPEPIPEPTPEPEPEATPEPTQELSGDSPAELIWELTRLPGYTLDGGSMCILLPRDSDLEGFCRNLEALDVMQRTDAIDAHAHSVAVASLLRQYKRRDAQ